MLPAAGHVEAFELVPDANVGEEPSGIDVEVQEGARTAVEDAALLLGEPLEPPQLAQERFQAVERRGIGMSHADQFSRPAPTGSSCAPSGRSEHGGSGWGAAPRAVEATKKRLGGIPGDTFMKILIVDDNRAMRMIVRRHVESARLAATEILEAANGADALAMIRAEPPDLVFSDWSMPEMDGIDLLRTVRAEGSSVRIGLVASESEAQMRQTALDAGALFVIERPFTAADFQAVLARVL